MSGNREHQAGLREPRLVVDYDQHHLLLGADHDRAATNRLYRAVVMDHGLDTEPTLLTSTRRTVSAPLTTIVAVETKVVGAATETGVVQQEPPPVVWGAIRRYLKLAGRNPQ